MSTDAADEARVEESGVVAGVSFRRFPPFAASPGAYLLLTSIFRRLLPPSSHFAPPAFATSASSRTAIATVWKKLRKEAGSTEGKREKSTYLT